MTHDDHARHHEHDDQARRHPGGPAPGTQEGPDVAGEPAATPGDPLVDALAGLAAEPPPSLIDRVVARWVRVPGPVGEVDVAVTDRGIAYLRTVQEDFAASFRERFERPLLPGGEPPAGLEQALRTGRSVGVPLDLRELTGFQREVLEAAREIPSGEVRSYRWVAGAVGRPRAVRAVGSALGRNPVPLLIPCHRVTRGDGGLGGYVFGPEIKEALLCREGAVTT